MVSKKSLVLYAIPVLVAVIIFQNHYARDTVGALEKQLESDLKITPQQYSTLNSLFFVPNIFAPLLMGFLSEVSGGPAKLLIYSVVVASIGHSLFALGAQISSLPLFYLGRFVAGVVYEVMDTVPMTFLGPLFKQEWGLVTGLLNGFLRLGSVFCFLMNPYFYSNYGILVALWVSAALVTSGVLAGIGSLYCERWYKMLNKTVSSDDVITEYHNALNNHESNKSDCEKTALGVDDGATDSESQLAEDCSDSRSLSGADLPDRHSESEDATTWVGWVVRMYDKYLPLHTFGLEFHLFNGACCCLYGAMVPFWFLGSKFMQINYHMSVGRADALMLLPEGVMVVISPISGYLLDSLKVSLRTKLLLLGLSCGGLAVSYVLLAFGYDNHTDAANNGETTYHVVISPFISMPLLGVSYAFSNSLLWTSIIFVIQDKHLTSASGFAASAMNLLPSVVPHVILWLEELLVRGGDGKGTSGAEVEAGGSNVGLYVLTFFALCSALFAVVAAIMSPSTDSHTDGAASVKKPSKLPSVSRAGRRNDPDRIPPSNDLESTRHRRYSELEMAPVHSSNSDSINSNNNSNTPLKDFLSNVTKKSSSSSRATRKDRTSNVAADGVQYSSLVTGDYDDVEEQ